MSQLDRNASRETLFHLGGFLLFAGIVARNKYLGYGALCVMASATVPDLVRYVKMKTM